MATAAPARLLNRPGLTSPEQRDAADLLLLARTGPSPAPSPTCCKPSPPDDPAFHPRIPELGLGCRLFETSRAPELRHCEAFS